jgi:hypothetical protein
LVTRTQQQLTTENTYYEVTSVADSINPVAIVTPIDEEVVVFLASKLFG